MKNAFIIFVFAALLSGCKSPATQPDMPTGARAAPPFGAVEFCIRNPTHELCQ